MGARARWQAGGGWGGKGQAEQEEERAAAQPHVRRRPASMARRLLPRAQALLVLALALQACDAYSSGVARAVQTYRVPPSEGAGVVEVGFTFFRLSCTAPCPVCTADGLNDLERGDCRWVEDARERCAAEGFTEEGQCERSVPAGSEPVRVRCTECGGAESGRYESVPCGEASDAECAPCADCGEGEYEVLPCTATSPRVCAPCSARDAGECAPQGLRYTHRAPGVRPRPVLRACVTKHRGRHVFTWL